MVRKLIFILMFTFTATIFANAQEQPKQNPDCGVRPKIGETNPDCFKPIVYGSKEDGFPKKMKIKGVVTRVTMTHISCGVLCLWGTAEIKLLEKPKDYNHEYLYVTVLCFGGKSEDYIGKIVEQKVIKSEEHLFQRLYCTIIYNFLDSQGKPFYIPYEKGHSPQYKLRVVGDYEAQKTEVACK